MEKRVQKIQKSFPDKLGLASIQFLLTGAVSELKTDMRPPKHVDRDGQLDLLRPAGAVVVVQHQGVVLIRTWFARAGSHVTLKERGGGGEQKKEQEVKTGNEDEVRDRCKGHKELRQTQKDRNVLYTGNAF